VSDNKKYPRVLLRIRDAQFAELVCGFMGEVIFLEMGKEDEPAYLAAQRKKLIFNDMKEFDLSKYEDLGEL